MWQKRVHNFYAGPTMLPESVLQRIERELTNFAGTGMSVMEISHRAPAVERIIDETCEKTKSLLGLGDDFEVILMQGGGSMQFCMIPMNFSKPGEKIDYINTGYWTERAINEAMTLGRDLEVIATTASDNFNSVPAPNTLRTREGARYLHVVTNNTVEGTQFHEMPRVQAPLIADMSSDLFMRPIDPNDFDMLYAHAQKQVGIAGVTIIAIRKSLLKTMTGGLPALLDYQTHITHRSNYHTPPTFAIYVTWLMLQWMEELGGLTALEEMNRKKSETLYNFLDTSSLFVTSVQRESRSWMNVVFELPTKEMTEAFARESHDAGLVGLAGHRSRGGLRASIFNGVTQSSVDALVDFMHRFEQAHASHKSARSEEISA